MNLAQKYIKGDPITPLRELSNALNQKLYWFRDKSFAIKSKEGTLTEISSEKLIPFFTTIDEIAKKDPPAFSLLRIFANWLKYDTEAALFLIDKNRQYATRISLDDPYTLLLFKDKSSLIINTDECTFIHLNEDELIQVLTEKKQRFTNESIKLTQAINLIKITYNST